VRLSFDMSQKILRRRSVTLVLVQRSSPCAVIDGRAFGREIDSRSTRVRARRRGCVASVRARALDGAIVARRLWFWRLSSGVGRVRFVIGGLCFAIPRELSSDNVENVGVVGGGVSTKC